MRRREVTTWLGLSLFLHSHQHHDLEWDLHLLPRLLARPALPEDHTEAEHVGLLADLLAAGLPVASDGRLAAGLGAVPVAPSVSGTRFAK